jgi:hypothetical protein
MRIPPKTAALSLLAATQFVLVLDASIVNVALPRSVATSASPRRTCPGSLTPTS